MEISIKQLGHLLRGIVEGDDTALISKLAKIEEGEPGSVSFLANAKYTHHLYTTRASAVVVNKDFVPEAPVAPSLIRVDDAYSAFTHLLELYNQQAQQKTGVDPSAQVSKTAVTGSDVYIGACAVIGECVKIGTGVKIHPQVFIGDDSEIGDHTVIHAGVKIYAHSKIGSSCVLHAGVIIGADGFGFAPQGSDYKKVPQTGNVLIEDHVEIGANTTIDRATLGSTIIRKGVKLDNLIQVAHNVEIGENTVIAAQTGIAGSTRIGKNCMIGGQVGIVGHLQIADGVKIAAQSGVGTSILNPGEIVQGSPAFTIGDYKRVYVVFKKLPELEKKLEELERLVNALKK